MELHSLETCPILKSLGPEYLSILKGSDSPVGRALGSVLSLQSGGGGKASIKEAATAFEQILMEIMVKTMRQTVQTNEVFGQSLGEEHYRGFLDSLYVELGAKRGGFGLCDALIEQLKAAGGDSPSADES